MPKSPLEMPTARMRVAGELAREELENIVRATQALLWQREHEDTGEPCWDPDNEWTSDNIEAIAGVLEAAGLKPTEGPIFRVNVYLVDKAYGGPEEGGWWFDTGVFRQSHHCADAEEAQRTLKTLEAWCASENQRRRSDTGSVLSEGKYVARIEHHGGADWPAERPHYE